MPNDTTVDVTKDHFEDEDGTWEPGKRIRFLITAEIDLDEQDIYSESDPVHDLKDQFVKIKSGIYENLASGFVTKVERLPDNTEEISE